MTYSRSIWHAAAKSIITKLQITQNKCLRVCLDRSRKTPIDLLRNVAGMLLTYPSQRST